MSRLKELEFKLACRRIKRVLEWHDPVEQDFPWSWVERSGDGRYELFTTVFTRDPNEAESDYAEPISLGYVRTPGEAYAMLAIYERWDRACEHMRRGEEM